MEILDVYDDNGNLTGKKVLRDKDKVILGPNEHIAIVMLFIENDEGKILMQKTSRLKDGLFAATGGHIISGESPRETIIRETKEELGIDIANDNLIYLGAFIEGVPIRHMYYLKKDILLEDIVIDPEEVEEVFYFSYDEIKELILKKQLRESNKMLLKKVMDYKNNN